MNYIYDILGNFQFNYYDSFEWNKEDQIIRIRKIPLIKVNEKFLYNVKYNVIKVDKDFLDIIEKKTEVFDNKGIDHVLYCSVFASEKECVIIKFNTNGCNVLKSSILLDEEKDVLEDIIDEKVLEIDYELIETKEMKFVTRKEDSVINKITKNINDLYESKEYEKLEYLYFECFNTKNTNYMEIRDILINNLCSVKIFNKISEFIKLISKV